MKIKYMIKNKISILVVDDEFDICEMVSEILKDENYNAIIATSYDMAVKILKKENIDLLITDIWMNNDTNAGLKLLTFSQNYNPLIPVIMMSGHGNIETAMKAAKNGAFDFIESIDSLSDPPPEVVTVVRTKSVSVLPTVI